MVSQSAQLDLNLDALLDSIDHSPSLDDLYLHQTTENMHFQNREYQMKMKVHPQKQ